MALHAHSTHATPTKPSNVKHAPVEAMRAFELSLPATGVSPHFESASFSVRGKIFVAIPLDEKHAHVFVDVDDTTDGYLASRTGNSVSAARPLGRSV
jgi:hypothetical protein